MDTIIRYSNKIMLAIGAVACFAASSMDAFPTAAVIFRIMGYAFAVWAIVEPKVEEVEE